MVNAVSGLGGFFDEDNKSQLATLMPKVLKFSHDRSNLLVIFQNNEDKGLYVKNGGLLGAMFWEYRGDTSGHDLLKSLVKALYGKDTVL